MKKSKFINNVIITVLLLAIVLLTAYILIYRQNNTKYSLLIHNYSENSNSNVTVIYNFNVYKKCTYTSTIFTIDNTQYSMEKLINEINNSGVDNYDIQVKGNTVYFKSRQYEGRTLDEIKKSANSFSTNSNYYLYDL